ncbi:MAG: hypothetical protein I8H77_02235 [Comamonadaceae bacterium]|nr:hypothetical protein [Comamonadaceae bacterium]
MKKRFLSIVTPLAATTLGVMTYLVLAYLSNIPRLTIYIAILVGLVLAFFEVQLIRKLPLDFIQYNLLDGKIFPFFSIGIATGMIL